MSAKILKLGWRLLMTYRPQLLMVVHMIRTQRPHFARLAGLSIVAGSLLVAAGLPVQAADGDHPPLTLSKTNAVSNSDHGDSVSLSGDGCPVGDGVIAYLLRGVVANDTTFADIPDSDEIQANSGPVVGSSGHASADLTIPGGSLAVPSGTYSVRLVCYPPGDDLMDDWSVLFETRQITINGDGVTPTEPPTSGPATSGPVTTNPGAPTTSDSSSTTMAPTGGSTPAATPAAAVATQPTYTG